MNEMITEGREKRIRDVYSKRQKDLVVVLENVWDPHNVSAVFRSCDSVGVATIYLVYPEGNFPHISHATSSSASNWVSIKKFKSITACYKSLKKDKFKIFTTYIDNEKLNDLNSIENLFSLDLTKKVALVFGNEKDGVSKSAYELADQNFLIPMVGMVMSLNISVSVAVTLYEAMRQRLIKDVYKKSQYTKKEIDEKVKADVWERINKRMKRTTD